MCVCVCLVVSNLSASRLWNVRCDAMKFKEKQPRSIPLQLLWMFTTESDWMQFTQLGQAMAKTMAQRRINKNVERENRFSACNLRQIKSSPSPKNGGRHRTRGLLDNRRNKTKTTKIISTNKLSAAKTSGKQCPATAVHLTCNGAKEWTKNFLSKQ